MLIEMSGENFKYSDYNHFISIITYLNIYTSLLYKFRYK